MLKPPSLTFVVAIAVVANPADSYATTEQARYAVHDLQYDSLHLPVCTYAFLCFTICAPVMISRVLDTSLSLFQSGHLEADYSNIPVEITVEAQLDAHLSQTFRVVYTNR